MKNYRIKSVLCIAFLAFAFSACNEESDPRSDYANRQYVRINKTAVYLQTGESITITASYDSEETANRSFAWRIFDTSIASVTQNENGSATVTGIVPGTTTIALESADGKLKYFSTLYVRNVYTLTAPILIDFGPVISAPHFNVFEKSDASSKLTNLKDNIGNDTEYSIEVITGFGWLDRNIPNNLGFPSQASNDMFFNDGGGTAQNPVESAGFILSNMKKTQKYTFYFYGSIDDRETETEYRVTGGREETVYLINDNNRSNFAIVKGITPNEDAQISIMMRPGPRNTQWARFYGINVMIITPEEVEYP